jgi:hypothetical protein
VILVPRQAGKTTLMRPIVAERCITHPGHSVVMSAQLGKDSSDRWEDLVADIENGPLNRFTDAKRGKGSQVLRWPNQSKIEPFTPTKVGVHGKSPHLGLIDEYWAFDIIEMDEILTALRPSMITRRDRQMYNLSAAGDATSTALNSLIDECRAEFDSGAYTTTAYFEWSPPEDADPWDEATWEFHPGLDGLLTIEDLREEAKPQNNIPHAFMRSFLNITSRQRDATVIDLALWDELGTDDPPPPALSQVAYGYEVAADRTGASVWSAWRDEDGLMRLRRVETHPGADWLAPYMIDVLRTRSPGIVAADDGGETRVVTAEIARAGYQVASLTAREYVTAWTSLRGMVRDKIPTVRHDRSPALRNAIEHAATRRSGDQTAISRADSSGPVDALIAAMVAAYYADRITSKIQIF